MTPIQALSSLFTTSMHHVSFPVTIFSLGRMERLWEETRTCLLCRDCCLFGVFFLPPGMFAWVNDMFDLGTALCPCRLEYFGVCVPALTSPLCANERPYALPLKASRKPRRCRRFVRDQGWRGLGFIVPPQ